MVASQTDDPQRILLVTGMLGAGKSTVLRELEDLGWEAIDNFPIRLLDRLIGPEDDSYPLAIGCDCRTRGFVPSDIIEQAKALTNDGRIELTTVFLDCAGHELERRFNETRRRHFLAADLPVSSGIAAERELLAPLRRWAEVLIDTTNFSVNDLKLAVRERFAPSASQQLTVTVSSFGFSRGMPPSADLVFDMRFIDNPHWVEQLRPMTGLDAPVGEHIERDPTFPGAFAKIADLVTELLPRYAAQGKTYVNIAFGCTGGRHRSVYSAQKLAGVLHAAGFSPTVIHRNLGARATELVEDAQHP
ncbi:RNase adapter RapZ [Aurantiacibacter xanthus]|uniref:RNase adapter RapZ n=1 Tax=Aurantiacibacter xanthus TaxID=1784712 RepID=A0A3A1PEG5_9SPHN|nr:RNase adapter RapZ [Aurantiacibacter xanthus]RIV91116.1 RNase adapter RapZ [Aurantiacibacter xanthus]